MGEASLVQYPVRILRSPRRLGELTEPLSRARRALAESMRPIIDEGPTLLVLAECQLRDGEHAEVLSTVDRALRVGGAADFLVEANAMAAEFHISMQAAFTAPGNSCPPHCTGAGSPFQPACQELPSRL